MAKTPSKRQLAAYVVAVVLLPILGVVASAAVITRGWAYYGSHYAMGGAAGSVTVIPSLDVSGAVSVLRGNAKPEMKAAAFAALEQQATSGNAKAMVMTAACYRARLGTVRDDHFKAFEWYRKAAQAGEPVAMVEMSRYYADGVWVEANASESKRWLALAAKAGSVEATWQLSKGSK